MQHPRNPGIRLVRQLFVSFPHSWRGAFATLLSGRHANSKMFIDKAYASKCCQATDIYQVKVVEERCARQLICVRNDRRVEREATSKGAIINGFEGGKSSRLEKLMPARPAGWLAVPKSRDAAATRNSTHFSRRSVAPSDWDRRTRAAPLLSQHPWGAGCRTSFDPTSHPVQ